MIVRQTALLVLVTALVGMTLLVGGALAFVDTGMTAGEASTVEAALADAQSDRLVSATGPIAVRSQVIDPAAAARLDPGALGPTDAAVAVRIDGQTLLRIGDPTGGTTVKRVVLLQRTTPVSHVGRSVTVPRGVTTATVVPHGPTVVRANGRVIYAGTERTTLHLSHRTRTTLRTAGPPMTVHYDRVEREPAMLSVTVDHQPDGGERS